MLVKTTKSVFVQIEQMKYNGLIEMLIDIFLNFGQSQASCFPLFPVFMLSYTNRLLTVTSYLTYRHESAINLLFCSILLARNKCISKNAKLFH